LNEPDLGVQILKTWPQGGIVADRALSDMKVLDFTHYIPGPYSTKLLADYGADVIKVEKPDQGDISRDLGPFPDDKPDVEKSALFLYLNTNKKGITLNLKTAKGIKIVKELVKWADVVVESFRPGVMAGFGLDYQSLIKINPRLVVTSISNFGQTGPYRDYRASEIIIYGMGGSMLVTGQPDRYPLKLGGTITLFQGGVIASVATMAAFFALRDQGLGQYVDISLFQTAAGSIDRRSSYLVNYQYTRRLPSRQQVAGLGYPYGIYRCADGYFDIASPVRSFSQVAHAMGMPELAEDQRFSTAEAQTDPVRQEEFERTIFLPWLRKLSRKEAFEACQRHGVFCGMCNTTEDVASDPHLQKRRFFVTVDHSKAGIFSYPGAPFKMDETPYQIRFPAPLLGQYNKEILCDMLGYCQSDFFQLQQEGII
jgi:crotonobetainyl-CoA:carnitine CoA-transferase CaiB-like acyl-CoA transferase